MASSCKNALVSLKLSTLPLRGSWGDERTLRIVLALFNRYQPYFKDGSGSTKINSRRQRTAAIDAQGRTTLGVQLARKIVATLWRVICVLSWSLLGLWTAAALFFTIPLSISPAAVLALGIVVLFASALRERIFVRGRGIAWRDLRRSAAALTVTAAVAVWYFGFVTPYRNEDWTPQHSRMPHVEIVGDKVHVSNVRNFTWHTATEFTPGFDDRDYDVNTLSSMYFVLSPIFNSRAVSHVWLGFGFSDGRHVAVSVEARGVKERPYGLFRSMFRQFQLIYVIGDERDVVGLRGAIWRNEVRIFRARSTPERMRALFLDMMERAHSLEEHPEFYNLFTNNCMNNVTYHIRRLGGRPLPADWRLLLTGFSDRLAFDYGFLDTDLPFEVAHRAYRIDEWMQQTSLDEGFSQRLRETLRRQGADKLP
jgi:hypothetical protein